MPQGSLIVGCDLSPIKPIPRVTSFQSDITTADCRATLRNLFKGYQCDTVIHDGAPNVGTAWNQDAFDQSHGSTSILAGVIIANLLLAGLAISEARGGVSQA
jgi:23S rRNA U2552 (ribose-2'-O)-methylase RlmE/FtsJ